MKGKENLGSMIARAQKQAEEEGMGILAVQADALPELLEELKKVGVPEEELNILKEKAKLECGIPPEDLRRPLAEILGFPSDPEWLDKQIAEACKFLDKRHTAMSAVIVGMMHDYGLTIRDLSSSESRQFRSFIIELVKSFFCFGWMVKEYDHRGMEEKKS